MMMKRLLLLLALLPGYAVAAPFVVGDVVAGVSQCGVVIDGQPKVMVPAVNLMCRFDVGTVSNGQHTVTMTAIAVNDPVWGTQESAPSAPFVFARPAAPSVPGKLRLEQ